MILFFIADDPVTSWSDHGKTLFSLFITLISYKNLYLLEIHLFHVKKHLLLIILMRT